MERVGFVRLERVSNHIPGGRPTLSLCPRPSPSPTSPPRGGAAHSVVVGGGTDGVSDMCEAISESYFKWRIIEPNQTSVLQNIHEMTNRGNGVNRICELLGI